MKIIREKFFNSSVLVHDVSAQVRREDDYNTSIWEHGDEILPSDLVIGLSPTNFHAFLRTNLWEVHPRFSFNKIKVLKSRQGSIRAQLFLRIRGLELQDVEKINKLLPTLLGKRTLSCIEGVRQALYLGAGLSTPTLTRSDLYISQFIFQAITKGMLDSDGKKLQVDIFKTRNLALFKIFKELTFAESCFNPIGIASYYWYQIGVKSSADKVEEFDGHKGPGFFDNTIKNFTA